ncbi:hypothetical protein GCM10009759_36390 [Kitasatospora saccharophila]|uniref:WXG100 family type VII secretion target n=1 Tax=Kitasatospora saccharophila TaxID=407973 RepID=A0ABN2X004_9ACTN
MADETVWIDLDEVEAAAKKILGLLDELTGPANQLAAKVKQVQATVYGTDQVGKAIQGGSSSVGGLAEHQEQVLQGIGVLIQNATAVGQNLQSMAARHRANEDQQATALGGIMGDGTMPAGPGLASAGTYLSGGATVGTPGYESSLPLGQATPGEPVLTPGQDIWAAPVSGQLTSQIAATPDNLPHARAGAELLTPDNLPHARTGATLLTGEHLPLARPEMVEATPAMQGTPALHTLPRETVEATPALHVLPRETEQLPAFPVGAPAPPPPIEGLGNIDPDGGYQSAETPDLDYNPPPPPPYLGPGMWAPTGHGV